jgi:hypothetical protein
METIRGLLKALEFESVDVVEGPDDLRPPHKVVEGRIRAADCVLVLYGPQRQPASGQTENVVAAKWPEEEALFAHGCNKPLSLIVHPETDLPKLLRDHQSPARFDFWSPQSFQENAHHVVKHLLDFRRRVDLPPGNQPYRYKKAELRLRIDRSGSRMYQDWYHEVVVAKTRSSFHHAISTGSKPMVEEVTNCFLEKRYEVEAGTGGDWHRVSVELGPCNEEEFQYFVRIDPALQPGEVFGYRRSFDLPNRIPLTIQEVRSANERSQSNARFPSLLVDGRSFGEPLDVVYDADNIVYAYHLPKKLNISKYRVLVVEYLDRQVENRAESDRCNDPSYLSLRKEAGDAEQILELRLPRPLFNHSYYLLYEIDS